VISDIMSCCIYTHNMLSEFDVLHQEWRAGGTVD